MAAITQAELHDALQELHEALKEAYWDASGVVEKDQIRGVDDLVVDLISDCNRQTLSARTEEFKRAQATVADINKGLTKLKQNIDNVVHRIQTATKVVKAIDKAVGTAAKFFV